MPAPTVKRNLAHFNDIMTFFLKKKNLMRWKRSYGFPGLEPALGICFTCGGDSNSALLPTFSDYGCGKVSFSAFLMGCNILPTCFLTCLLFSSFFTGLGLLGPRDA